MPRNQPQRNCTFMNSASVEALIRYFNAQNLRIWHLFRERSPNKMASQSMEDPLCCCEYRNRRGERAHLLGLCCDCEEVDRSAILKLRISWFAQHDLVPRPSCPLRQLSVFGRPSYLRLYLIWWLDVMTSLASLSLASTIWLWSAIFAWRLASCCPSSGFRIWSPCL